MAFKMNYKKSMPSVIGFPGEKMNNVIEEMGNGNGKNGPKTQRVDRDKQLNQVLSTEEGTKKIAQILATKAEQERTGVTDSTKVNPNNKVFDEAIVINKEDKKD
tara:strand:+ start:1092 stop:1403 length:312 start_codon:yes stop_codon:yes gene_type:complete